MAEIGADKPDISILTDEFLEEFKNMKHKNIAVEMLKRLIQGKLRGFSKRQ